MGKSENQVIADVRVHFSESISQAFCEYVENVALIYSRYIFTWRKGKKQFGYCTHCKHEYETDGLLRDGKFATCGWCGSECVLKASGRSRKHLIDEAYIVWYERSVVNPKAITARGVHVTRDYRENFRGVSTQFRTKALYLFEPGKGGTMIDHANYISEGKWFVNETIHSFTQSFAWSDIAGVKRFCPVEPIVAAVEGTPFQFSTWESWVGWGIGDMVKFFDLFAKYPCIEYLCKLGFREVVEAKLYGLTTYSAVNWRGGSLPEVLRLTKQDLNQLRESKLVVDPWVLFLCQQSKKEGWNFSTEELKKLSIEISNTRSSDLKKVLKRTTLRKMTAYLVKQQRNPEVYKHYRTKGEVLQIWGDYIDDCVKLNFDLTHERVLFPVNLYQAHQNTIQQVEVKENELLRAKIESRRKALSKFQFEAFGFIIRPTKDQKELIEEGKALHHCVGGYADKYAKGESDIFVIRKVEKPDEPFFTMEIKNGTITQCYGLKHCRPPHDVEAFIKAFTREKLAKRKSGAKLAEQRMEVAV
ncbi:PcfJ domain-containing protein [Tumebacillus permanentifrigoris]|uniref:PcfJ-like protein n=1 Tax=Tumebacillus permanentifrigoris TaxID=378543 RepID=A0A316D2U3_9BACL|nr:PcfJ domain-containing protein [Tumebacillus permanentifrigoris]PWK05263.1 PcfJ-like protein [Tumebacillus permanentifrigoris]